MGFTHLHVASGFSARYGASHPGALAERAAERGMEALALTDRDSLAGALRFAKATAKVDVRPLYGVELAIGPHPAPSSDTHTRRRTPARGGAFLDETAPRAVFLARDGEGWSELCRLVTAAHRTVTPQPGRGGDRPVLRWPDLYGERLLVLLGPDSEVGRALATGRPDRAVRLLEGWRERFGPALRLEVSASAPPREAARMLGLAVQQGIHPVLTNAVRYADPTQHPVADVLDSARRLVPIDPRQGLDPGERWLKGPAEMARLAERIAESAGYRRAAAHRLLTLTEEAAEQCRVDAVDDLGMGSAHFPEPHLVGAGSRGAARVLRSRCVAGMVARGYEGQPERWRRLEWELAVIEGHHFSSYFLTVAQVVRDVRRLGIRVAARGSGAGSLVNHLLGVAQADPMAHGLLMERFLSPRRRALPDVDIDVESARRLEVYRAIFQRFGPERVATVAMPETYRVRHAIRDVGAALSLDPAEVDRLAKAFPHIRAQDARSALAELPELREVDQGRYGSRFWDLVEALDGLPRGMAMHPCGVLLSHSGLLDRTPVVPTSGEGFAMSQFDKDDVEDLGLLKLDVLGVRMQSAMAHAVHEVERVAGERIDLERLPADDPATFALIRSTRTLGCFQIESPGQRDLLGRLQPTHLHDLVVDISLFRPGPVAADMVRPFVETRHGDRAPRYPHPDLEPVLRETHGVVVFHEQIIEILRVMTGCDRASADGIRRRLAQPDQRERVRVSFDQRARARGYSPEVVTRTWKIVEAFGAYGFCKAHAVAFAVPTYQSAWLKAHHPAAFYTGLLTHDPGMYPKRLLLADARRQGVPILPLEVNRSGAGYQVEWEPDSRRWGIRLALSEVRGISEAEAERVAAGRPYGSLGELWLRGRPSRPVAEHLARVGALDTFGDNRRDLLLHVAEAYRVRQAAPRGQLVLEAGTPEGPADSPRPAGLPDLDRRERLNAELGVLGMDVSRHLMDDHGEFLAELGVCRADRLPGVAHGDTVLVAGAKASLQTPPIRSGRRVIFATLDDGTGLVDCAFFDDPPGAEPSEGPPSGRAACAHTLFHRWLLLVRGVVQRRGPRSLSVVGAMAWDLGELIELRASGGLEAVTVRLREALEERSGPLPTGGRTVQVAEGYAMHPWADLRPAGEGTPTGRKLWHSSPGSAG
ncbi:DNA polymerase III subunit alpha [Streptomyces sp. NPDC005438]|uniref:DNA polymerase III subunit alpha n=1 Tax=Streptomyces sp. NPDC005438 TaxID=3156880 RepID=UPI0033B2E890